MTEFDNLVALVTGGASGIGAAAAKLLVERGARVAVLDRPIEGVSNDVEHLFNSLNEATRRPPD
jgi:2-keto-3-deoxy-L-fuconate dehydrogenase